MQKKLFIAPTLMETVSANAPIMKDEIFGPILPVISFSTMQEALQIIEQHPNPLAFYLFTGSKNKQRQWIEQTPFGGGCVNNTVPILPIPIFPWVE